MHVDNYTRGVLTIIALCLVYLCARDAAPAASAQAAPTRVVITGVAIDENRTRNVLPIGVVGAMRVAEGGFIALPPEPVGVQLERPVDIRTERPIKVEADRPLPVRAIREPGSQRPGPD